MVAKFMASIAVLLSFFSVSAWAAGNQVFYYHGGMPVQMPTRQMQPMQRSPFAGTRQPASTYQFAVAPHPTAPAQTEDIKLAKVTCKQRRPDGAYDFGACVVENGVYFMIRRRAADNQLFIDRAHVGRPNQDLPENLTKELLDAYDKRYFADHKKREFKKDIDPKVQEALTHIYTKYRPETPAIDDKKVPDPLPDEPVKVADKEKEKDKTGGHDGDRKFEGGPTKSRTEEKEPSKVAEKFEDVDCDAMAKQITTLPMQKEEIPKLNMMEIMLCGETCSALTNEKRQTPGVTDYIVSTSAENNSLIFTHGEEPMKTHFRLDVGEDFAKYAACFDKKKVMGEFEVRALENRKEKRMTATVTKLSPESGKKKFEPTKIKAKEKIAPNRRDRGQIRFAYTGKSSGAFGTANAKQ